MLLAGIHREALVWVLPTWPGTENSVCHPPNRDVPATVSVVSRMSFANPRERYGLSHIVNEIKLSPQWIGMYRLSFEDESGALITSRPASPKKREVRTWSQFLLRHR